MEICTYTYKGLTKYLYSYGEERFARDIKTAYKISIYQSKRVNNVVTKKQYAVTTVGYYNFVTFWIEDCVNHKKLADIAEKLETDTEHLWGLIYNKVNPIQERGIRGI